jgi:hypothetical protein
MVGNWHHIQEPNEKKQSDAIKKLSQSQSNKENLSKKKAKRQEYGMHTILNTLDQKISAYIHNQHSQDLREISMKSTYSFA